MNEHNEAALLCFNDYAGYREYPIRIIGETRDRWRITTDKPLKLAGRNRWLEAGESTLVPKSAVKLNRAALGEGGTRAL